MERFVKDHRRQVGPLNAIDWADEEAYAQTLAPGGVTAPVPVHWCWEYGSEAEQLRNLYEKGKHGQWDAETDLDWDIPVSRDEWVMNPELSLMGQVTKAMGLDEETQKQAVFEELNYGISQMLHAEQGALQLCGQLTNVCTLMDEKWYAASQTIDEARHVEVMAKFIERKMDKVYAITPTVKLLLDNLLTIKGVAQKTLGMQTIFESVALGAMDRFRREVHNELFCEMIRRVESDEARHAAFGVLMMRRVVKEATPDEMAEMEDWSFALLEALNACQKHDLLHVLGPKYGVDPDNVIGMVTSLPDYASYNSQMYMHAVIPNLRRLGLITDRTIEQYRECGIIYGERGDELPEFAMTGWETERV